MVKWEKEGHYIMIENLNHQEDITIINSYAPNIRAPKKAKPNRAKIRNK